MKTKKIIFILLVSISWFSCVAQNQKIILDKKNIKGQCLYFPLNLDDVVYKSYLSDVNEDGVFTSANVDALGFSEEKTRKGEFGLQKPITYIKGKKYIYAFTLQEDSTYVELIIEKQKRNSVKFDIDIYNMSIPSLTFKNLETGQDGNLDDFVGKSKKKYLILNLWAPFCPSCLESFSKLPETDSLSVDLINISLEEENESAIEVLKTKKLHGNFYYVRRSDILDGKINIGGGYPQYYLYDIKAKKLMQLSHSINHVLNYIYKNHVQN